MARKDYTVYDCFVDHRSPEYKRGVEQLKAWHEQCRERRLGITAARRKLERMGIIEPSSFMKVNNKRRA